MQRNLNFKTMASILKKFRDMQLAINFGEDFKPRNEAQRNQVLEYITPLSEGIMKAIVQAELKYLDFASDNAIARQCGNFPPTLMTSLIVQEISLMDEFQISPFSKGNNELITGDYKIWVKKVDDKFQPKFNMTKSTLSRANQLSQKGDDQQAILILGYQLDDSQKISGVHLIYQTCDKHVWAPINLGDLGAQEEEKSNSNAATQIEEVPMKVKRNGNNLPVG